LRQRKQPVSSASSENYSQQFWSGRHCVRHRAFCNVGLREQDRRKTVRLSRCSYVGLRTLVLGV
jgi:hypothetical protein